MDSDRRLRGHERPNRRILLVWLALSALILLAAMQRIMQGQFPDPDDALRLVQVRDLLAGQNWFDTTQYRIDPPGGSPMHWSRLVDIPLVLVIGLLTPLFGQSTAEQVALIAVPLLTFGVALWCIGRLAWRLFDKQVATYAMLVCGFMPALLFQFQPLRIDHHGWQIASVCAALWALALRKPHHGGAVAGIAMAVGLSISIEILPMAATFAAVLFVRWLRDHHARWWLVAYLQALAIGLGAIFLLTRGLRDLAQHCDAISPAHIGFFLVVALGVGAIGWRSRATSLALIALLGLAGAAGIGFFALSSPDCVATPFGSLDPLVKDYWYVYVMEGQPYWRQQQAQAVPVLVQLLVALAAALALRARSKDWLRNWWTDYALLLAGALLLALFVWRSAAFASALAAIPLGWLLAGLLTRLRHAQGAGGKVGAIALIVLLLAPSTPLFLQRKLIPLEDEAQVTHVEESGCAIREQAAKLDALAPATLFAPLDIGPAILVKSRHAVVATGHHRAETAMHDVIAAFTSDPDEARQIVKRHGGDYIVMCSDLVEPRLYASANPQGLMARLLAGNTPGWLEPVAFDGPAEFRIWKVRKEPGAKPE
ncbi:ArnT family glycosyltransferase [Parerythrobacter lacustris]|uniref:AcrB/AcrD/AcrF family protein n=1 Tax=Parerythrobacter lacustris TaxID=2969984 RepID=A0ABT1XL78_9SPHN|nr:hypothetical protein [Parerythrobacter lacustris]MCR2832418.1 hypothetical protein [Parerythrobacter lacustris]